MVRSAGVMVPTGKLHQIASAPYFVDSRLANGMRTPTMEMTMIASGHHTAPVERTTPEREKVTENSTKPHRTVVLMCRASGKAGELDGSNMPRTWALKA